MELPPDVPPIVAWIIAGLLAIISALVTFATLAIRHHLGQDAKREAETVEAKSIAASSSANVGALVAAVKELTTAVQGVDTRAIERYETIRRDGVDIRNDVRDFRGEWRTGRDDLRDALDRLAGEVRTRVLRTFRAPKSPKAG